MHYGGDGRMSKSIWAHEPIITPELKLWRAVLEQACVDAELPLASDGSESMERALARRFLRADGASEVKDLNRGLVAPLDFRRLGISASQRGVLALRHSGTRDS